MNRRLRKKLRRGEFRELAFPVYFETPGIKGHGILFDLREAAKGMGLSASGGGSSKLWEFFVVAPGRRSCTYEDQERVLNWLLYRSPAMSIRIGRLFDRWHGPFPAFEGPVMLRTGPGR